MVNKPGSKGSGIAVITRASGKREYRVTGGRGGTGSSPAAAKADERRRQEAARARRLGLPSSEVARIRKLGVKTAIASRGRQVRAQIALGLRETGIEGAPSQKIAKQYLHLTSKGFTHETAIESIQRGIDIRAEESQVKAALKEFKETGKVSGYGLQTIHPNISLYQPYQSSEEKVGRIDYEFLPEPKDKPATGLIGIYEKGKEGLKSQTQKLPPFEELFGEREARHEQLRKAREEAGVPFSEKEFALQRAVEGFVEGQYEGIRQKPEWAGVSLILAAGTGPAFKVGRYGAKVLKVDKTGKIIKKIPGVEKVTKKASEKFGEEWLGKAFGYGTGAGYLGSVGYRASKAEDKPYFFGELTTTELLPGVAGYKATKPLVRRLTIKEQFKLKVKELERTDPKRAREFKDFWEDAVELGKVRPKVKDIDLSGLDKVPKEARGATKQFLREQADKQILGGSIAQRSQVYGVKRSYADSDLDFYVNPGVNPVEQARLYEKALKDAGVKRVSRPPKSKAEVTIDGKKTAEFHEYDKMRRNIEEAEGLFSYTPSAFTRTPSGVKILRASVQTKRKLIGGYLDDREKDIPDFEKLTQSLFETSRLQAKPKKPRDSFIEALLGKPSKTTKKQSEIKWRAIEGDVGHIELKPKYGSGSFVRLYHGTSSKNFESIMREGLKKGKPSNFKKGLEEPYISLTLDKGVARAYAGSKGKIVKVDIPKKEFKSMWEKQLFQDPFSMGTGERNIASSINIRPEFISRGKSPSPQVPSTPAPRKGKDPSIYKSIVDEAEDLYGYKKPPKGKYPAYPYPGETPYPALIGGGYPGGYPKPTKPKPTPYPGKPKPVKQPYPVPTPQPKKRITKIPIVPETPYPSGGYPYDPFTGTPPPPPPPPPPPRREQDPLPPLLKFSYSGKDKRKKKKKKEFIERYSVSLEGLMTGKVQKKILGKQTGIDIRGGVEDTSKAINKALGV